MGTGSKSKFTVQHQLRHVAMTGCREAPAVAKGGICDGLCDLMAAAVQMHFPVLMSLSVGVGVGWEAT